MLFGDLRACFAQTRFRKLLRTQMVGYNLDDSLSLRNLYIACDVAAFKSQPTKDPSVPYRFLVSFNPPLAVENLFAELDHGLECVLAGAGRLGRVPRGSTRCFYDIEPYGKFQPHTLHFAFPVGAANQRCFLLRDLE